MYSRLPRSLKEIGFDSLLIPQLNSILLSGQSPVQVIKSLPKSPEYTSSLTSPQYQALAGIKNAWMTHIWCSGYLYT
jgi:hypothetical protein